MRVSNRTNLARIRADQLDLCFYCGSEFIEGDKHMAPSIDHRTPKAFGGTRARVNLVAACMRCNKMKGDLTEAQFWIAYKMAHDYAAARVPTDRNWERREIHYQANFVMKLGSILKKWQVENARRREIRIRHGWTPIATIAELTGCSSARPECSVRNREIRGSNPLTPTNTPSPIGAGLVS